MSTDLGNPLWTYQFSDGSIFATPLLHPPDYSLLSVALDGSVVKLDISSNYDTQCREVSYPIKCPAMIWKQNVKDPVFSTPILTSLDANMVLAIVINVKGRVFIFDYTNQGHVLWTHSVGANIFSSPILLPSNDSTHRNIVFGGHNKYLYKLAITNEKHRPLDSDTMTQVERIEKSNIDEHDLECNFQWQVLLDETIFSTPTAFLGDSQCKCSICSNNTKCNLINSTSNEKPKSKCDNSSLRTPCKWPTSLFIASVTTDGLLNILCAKSGERLKSYKIGHNIFSSPIIVSDHIVIGNRDNLLTCFQFNKNLNGCDERIRLNKS